MRGCPIRPEIVLSNKKCHKGSGRKGGIKKGLKD